MKPVKFTSTVSGASLLIATFAIASKGLGFLREVIFAGIYGLSTDFDIYLIGAVIPLTINTIILCLGQNYFIPSYNKVKSNDQIDSIAFVRTNFYLFIVIGIILSSILFFVAEPLLSLVLYDSGSELLKNTYDVFTLFLLSIPLTAGISVIIGYQQSNRDFKHSVISNIIPNISVLITVYFFGNNEIIAIPIGFIIGNLFQIVYLMISSSEIFKKLNASYSLLNFLLKSSYRSIVIIIMIESIGQLYLITDRYFYHSITSGGISALNYAQTVFSLPILILSISLSTAIFPKFSILFSEKKIEELERVFNTGIIINVGIFVPVMILFIFYGDFILKAVFERGRFLFQDTIMTSEVLFYYSLGIVFYSVYGVVNKLVYSAGLIKKLLIITIIGITLKIMFNFILVGYFEQNGLALSTSISYLFFFISSMILVYRDFQFKEKTVFLNNLLFYLMCGIIALAVAKIFVVVIQVYPASTLLEIIIFVAVYSINLFCIKNNLMNIIYSILNNISFAFKR